MCDSASFEPISAKSVQVSVLVGETCYISPVCPESPSTDFHHIWKVVLLVDVINLDNFVTICSTVSILQGSKFPFFHRKMTSTLTGNRSWLGPVPPPKGRPTNGSWGC